MLVGPSGCGKTTTLKMVNRLIEPTSGRIFLDGARRHPRRPGRAAPPHRIRDPAGGPVPAPDHRHQHRHGAEAAGVAEGAHRGAGRRAARPRRPRSCRLPRRAIPRSSPVGSGSASASRARSAADPPVLLMDEPFGAIDPVTRVRLQDEFLRLQGEVQKTVVFVTHDIEEAVKMGDRIAILDVGGILEQYATPAEILGRPASAMVRDFVGARPCAQAAAGHADRRGVPRAPADGRPRRHARGGACGDHEVGRRLGRGGRRRRHAARLRRPGARRR